MKSTATHTKIKYFVLTLSACSFSDKISLHSKEFPQQTLLNYCKPNSSSESITDTVSKTLSIILIEVFQVMMSEMGTGLHITQPCARNHKGFFRKIMPCVSKSRTILTISEHLNIRVSERADSQRSFDVQVEEIRCKKKYHHGRFDHLSRCPYLTGVCQLHQLTGYTVVP